MTRYAQLRQRVNASGRARRRCIRETLIRGRALANLANRDAECVDYRFPQRLFCEAIVNTAVPTTGILLSILAGNLQSSSVR
jgi:hypothetical protein